MIYLIVGLLMGYGLGLLTVSFRLDQVFAEGHDVGYKRGYADRDRELDLDDGK